METAWKWRIITHAAVVLPALLRALKTLSRGSIAAWATMLAFPPAAWTSGASPCCIMTAVPAIMSVGFRPQDFRTKAFFELTVSHSNVLRVGMSKVLADSAVVTLAHGLLGGSDGLEVLFFSKPINEQDKGDILNNEAKEMKKKADWAALVFFLDRNNKVWQVNLTLVVPGTTVARTVAWRPDELKKYFSTCLFDGERLLLTSNGSYMESSGEEELKLNWSVDLNLPVVREVKR